ncbi:class I SAM-dependent methyltransferase [Solirubrobacter ginsenosidimutans]|uniref:Class I SAM-dependent methyltransferase n=1 Tax=Solirubrobacter ginsenosidimutans TaxID=490573 RepID=A0A9X3S299_9ACTN|nr:class I SAM-dependent methyltransferase [Solirubrobacter ginsenosidimutans]MDA0163304.1 class I SAM-dependent methyltransferase [Solirubrobacter ginsenosidimutans]
MDATRQTFLDELYAHGRAHDEQREDRLQRLRNVEPETAELLGVLVRAMSATRVLEVGTSNGYSTIWLGDAAEAVGGSVISLEIEADRTAQAASNLTEAGVKEFVDLRTQDAAEALASFADAAFDLIFLDAERPLYAGYWPDLIRILRPNGLLVVDNTLSHAKDLVEFSELVYASEQVTSTLLTVGAGVLLIVKST